MNTDRLKPYVLSLFRFVAGLIFFHYGVAKFLEKRAPKFLGW
jgi:uncharacterized membrane protein YphA (DoxX/SURF4 family)